MRPATLADPKVVQQHHEAYRDVSTAAPGRPDWPPTVDDLFAGTTGVPEISAQELSAPLVASGIVHHGSLLVRNLFTDADVELMVGHIDRAMADQAAWTASAPPRPRTIDFSPFTPSEGYPRIGTLRKWVSDCGGCLAADSPQGFADLLAIHERVGLRQVLTEHFGVEPVISANKATLRRVPVDLAQADWHQDGAFLEKSVGLRTVNVWLALSDCGTDAPGLDVVPRRLDHLAERGTNGAYFDWSVGDATVHALCAEAPVARPQFKAGDAMIFDEFNLHRTALEPEMTRDRYAIECWFFDPATFPPHHVPLVL